MALTKWKREIFGGRERGERVVVVRVGVRTRVEVFGLGLRNQPTNKPPTTDRTDSSQPCLIHNAASLI